MDIKRLTADSIPEICNAVTDILMDAPEASYQLKNVTEKRTILHAFTNAQITYWNSTGEVWVLGDNQGILAGHYKEGIKILTS